VGDLASRALDVIVLSNTGPEKKFSPPADAWSLIFENDAFRVYSTKSETN
jgi:hypothetical protein